MNIDVEKIRLERCRQQVCDVEASDLPAEEKQRILLQLQTCIGPLEVLERMENEAMKGVAK